MVDSLGNNAGLGAAAVDPLEVELASSPNDLAEQVSSALKKVVQQTAWTIKKRQTSASVGFDIAKEPGELQSVQKACLQYVHSVGALRNWLVRDETPL